jgi:predicted HAD superfamily Cof-like phosphohydrolase
MHSQANMAKRCPVTGKFLKREDGKIIKPAGWQPPDVEGEIERQAREGSFASH